MDHIQRCLSEEELAEALDLSYWTVRQMRLRQGLPHIRCGRRIFYRMSVVNDWFSQQEQGSIHPINSSIRAIR